jgi:hypothetical protein
MNSIIGAHARAAEKTLALYWKEIADLRAKLEKVTKQRDTQKEMWTNEMRLRGDNLLEIDRLRQLVEKAKDYMEHSHVCLFRIDDTRLSDEERRRDCDCGLEGWYSEARNAF